MTIDHNEIKELLPDYLHDTIPTERAALIRAHLEECPECSDEFAALSEVSQLNVPDPGDLYWKTLPQKVRATVENTQYRFPFYTLFLRPLPAVGIAVMIFALLYLFAAGTNTQFFDPSYDDPFNEGYIDYTELNENAIPTISIEVAENDLYVDGDIYGDYSYYYDLTALGPDELDSLDKQLTEIKKTGG